jgi:glucosamine-6-phosphate deaminase
MHLQHWQIGFAGPLDGSRNADGVITPSVFRHSPWGLTIAARFPVHDSSMWHPERHTMILDVTMPKNVFVYPNRRDAGHASAAQASAIIRAAIERDGHAGVVFAAAPSQNELLAGLRADTSIDWRRVTAFHLDEYAGLPAAHPGSFRRFLRERLMDHVPLAAFHELAGEALDLDAEADRYQRLLAEQPPVLALLGIGENGHLAFIDPGECDFNDPRDVRIVHLDDACHQQQVHDGCFERVEDVPRRALSLTIPFFMRTPRAVVTVPGPAKARAVRDALEGPIDPRCPASILRQHSGAVLFLDADSAALLNGR